MKTFIVLITILAAVGINGDEKADEAEAKAKFLEKIAAECSEEIGFDFAQAKKLLLGDLSINSRDAKCFVKCFFTKEGFLREDGQADTKFIVKSLEGTLPVKRYELEMVVSKCSKFKTKDGCENAFWLLECFFRAKAAADQGEL